MIKIPRPLLEQMIEQARKEYPYECCGIVAGKGQRAVRLYPLTNVEKSSVTYLADATQQWTAMCQMEDTDLELTGIYHSHPHSPCYPSARDLALAHYPEASCIIISLIDFDRPEVRAFRIKDGQVSLLELAVEPEMDG